MDRVKLIDELVRDEGLETRAYWDCGHGPVLVCPKCLKGIATIGIGRNLRDNGVSREEAYHLCNNDIDKVEVELNTATKWWVNLPEARQRVLANMCFNMGRDSLLKFRNMLGAAQLGLWGRAADEMKASAWYAQVGPRAERLEEAMRLGTMP